MAFPTPNEQKFNSTLELYGTATAYSEAVTATGALDVAVPVSVISILGTATTVSDNYTLGTAPYEGYDKFIVTAQTATDGIGIANIELANAVGDPASQNITLEYPAALALKWVNDRWLALSAMSQGAAPAMSTATV